jgi:DNA-binding transcriptional LysR family regulator
MRFNLRGVDLNLLPVFEAVYEERSSSRAAQRLAMTQPAVSHAIGRLRALFNDELFIRHSRGVRPTPVADGIYARLSGALVAVRDAVESTRAFDPASTEREFFVAIAHPLGPLMAVQLRKRLARTAPRSRVAFSTRSRPIDQERGLSEGRIDVAVDWLVPADERFAESVVFEDGVVVMARRGHPALRQRSALQVAKTTGLALLRPRIDGEHPVPAMRELLRLPWRDMFEVSELIEVLMVARATDLLAPVPSSMEWLGREAFDLRRVTAIARLAPIPIRLVWHRGRERDPALAFLREELHAAVHDAIRDR